MKLYDLDIIMAVAGMPMSADTIRSGKSLGGCVTADTPIDIPRDLKLNPSGIPIKEVCERLERGDRLCTYSYDHASGKICLRPIKKAWLTKRNAEICELTYSWVAENGEDKTGSLRATPDHRIMLRDGTYKPVAELLPGDSLMPFNRFQGKRRDAKYFRLDMNNGQWEYEHQFIVKELGEPYRPKRGAIGDVVHHKNFKWHDNSLDNLRVMDWRDHLALHKGENRAFREWYDNLSDDEYQEFCQKQAILSSTYWNSMSAEERQVANAHSVKSLLRWHKNASPEQLRTKYNKIAASNKIAFTTRPDLIAQLKSNGRKAGPKTVANLNSPEVRARAKEAMTDPAFRARRAEAARRYWANMLPEERRLRGEAISRGLLAVSNHTVTSVRFLDAREDVYDLEIEGTHNFVANGIIIHNSETAGLQMAEKLAEMGHRVTLFCNTEKPHEGPKNLFFRPMGYVAAQNGGAFPKGYFDYVRSTIHDLLIVQRIPAFLQFDVPSKVNFLWQHDLATKTGPSFYAPYVWNIDKIFVLSEFMKAQYKAVHGGVDEIFHVTRNGIDVNAIDAVPTQERDQFRLTYTARPERGLDILLARVFPLILKKEPRAQLYLSRYEDPTTLPLYEQLGQLAAQFGDRIVNMGNLGKQALYENYKKSRLYLYPSAFEEVSCITSQEVAACGAVFVGPWRAALPETCGDGAILLKDDGTLGRQGEPLDDGFKNVSDEFVNAFAEWTVKLMHDDILWQIYRKRATERARAWTWDKVAEDWIRLAHDLIAERSNEPRRLMKHFLSSSDIVAAQKLAEREKESPHLAASVNRYINQFVPFMKETDDDKRREQIRDFYEARSGGDGADWRTGFWADTEVRLHVLLQWMKPKVESGEIKTVLDFGCAHGGYARAISNAFPQVKVVGVDTSKSLVRCAKEMQADQCCQHPDNLYFSVADEESEISNIAPPVNEQSSSFTGNTKFDLVVCMEVLEHLSNAEEVAKKLERHCRKDGWMLFTVPTGFRERDDFLTNGTPPVHVRSFDLHDIRDIFSERKDYGVMSFSDQKELAFDRSFSGWWMVFYRNDEKPLGQIDWERKLFLQGPRETLSVCMIVNNNEDVLHRSLRSIIKYADQLIVLDNGPSFDRTPEVAAEYTDDVRAGTSPFYCYAHGVIHRPEDINPDLCKPAGFETPRNESVEGAWGDWIMWLDSDEQLLEPRNMMRYLRPNCLVGYPMRQHHIAVDPVGAIKTDLPARMIRNHRGIKCYGLVHEHFELGINKGIGLAALPIPEVHQGGFVIHHDGYLTEQIRRKRFSRNLKILECDRRKYPDRLLGIYLYEIRDNMHLAQYELERTNGMVNDTVRMHCQCVVDNYRKHFLGKSVFFDEDGINYYSKALEILGIGVEVAYDLDVKPRGATGGAPKRFRAFDTEEAKNIISGRLEQLAAPWTGRYVA